MTGEEAAARCGANTDILRYCEENGLPVGSDGHRLCLIRTLLEAGMDLPTLRRYLALEDAGESSSEERVRLLRRDGTHVAGHFLTGHLRPPPESSARRARPRWSRRRHRRGSPPPAVPAPAA